MAENGSNHGAIAARTAPRAKDGNSLHAASRPPARMG